MTHISYFSYKHLFIKISIENIYYPIGNSYLTLHAYTIYFKDTNKKNRYNSVVQWTACCVLCWDARIVNSGSHYSEV